MNTRSLLLYIICLFGFVQMAEAQNFIEEDRFNENHEFESDSITKEDIPIGLFSWTLSERFGEIVSTPVDTIPHLFQNSNFTDGMHGEYNTTGNLGAPRINRIFSQRNNRMSKQFIFTQPFDYSLSSPSDFIFTNTKSPFANLSYHSCGSKTDGEDRITAYFAKNAGKKIGMGFKVDYLYGRGYYDQQSTAHLDASGFGYYTGDRYQAHLLVSKKRIKNTENGGIDNDTYVTMPESFEIEYAPADMPVRLTKSWNRIGSWNIFLTHRYNVGVTRYYNKEGQRILTDTILLSTPPALTLSKDSLSTDSLSIDSTAPLAEAEMSSKARAKKLRRKLSAYRPEFTAVMGFVHTLRMDFSDRRYVDNYGRQHYYNTPLEWENLPDSVSDLTEYCNVENTLAYEINEGFNRWAKVGLRLFAKHQFNSFTLPNVYGGNDKFVYNYINLGGQLYKRQGKYFHFDALGEIRTTGSDWGEFNAEATVRFSLPTRKDTLRLDLDGYVRNENPAFYYQHYRSRNTNWDNHFSKMLSAHVGATLSYKKTRLNVSLHSLQNYTYFQETIVQPEGTTDTPDLLFGVEAKQTGRNVQVVSATLYQDLKWGILHWDNALTYQVASEPDVLPLPMINAYSNLYLKFKIAKVLLTEFGADVRYFTKYYAPAYSPIIGQYAVQDGEHRVKLGNYPIVNAYINFHIKRVRFYVMASHVNHSAGKGLPFLTPHYPINRMNFRFGLSWNFFN